MNYYSVSDIGLIRESNQDSVYCAHNQNNEFLAIVCDGIGGGRAGDVASALACKTIQKSFEEKESPSTDIMNKKWIEDSVKRANDTVYENSLTSRTRHGMGTTLVGILISDGNTFVFHLGDSRVYGTYEGNIVCFTEDHNLAADLIKSGEMSEVEAVHHPRGKALTNALGIWSQYKVDIHKVKTGYQNLLLCSDGLHGYVSEKNIADVLLGTDTVKGKALQCIEMANRAGGFDNTSVIVIEDGGERHE